MSGTSHRRLELVRVTAAEWELQGTRSHCCVGYVTDYGGVFEVIEVLPPYEVTLVAELSTAVDLVESTVALEDCPLIRQYLGA